MRDEADPTPRNAVRTSDRHSGHRRRDFLAVFGVSATAATAGCLRLVGAGSSDETSSPDTDRRETTAKDGSEDTSQPTATEEPISGETTTEPTSGGRTTTQPNIEQWNDFDAQTAGDTPTGWDGTGIGQFKIDSTITAPNSAKSAMLPFGPQEVHHNFPEPRETNIFRCWFKTQSYADQQFQISLRNSTENLRCAEISTGRRNESVILANKYTYNDPRSGERLYESPGDGEWYEIIFRNFSWTDKTYDAELRSHGRVVAELNGLQFRDPEVRSVDSLWVINNMNITASDSWIDEIQIDFK